LAAVGLCIVARGARQGLYGGFFANANTAGAPDGTLRLANDGNTGGKLCASIYVFNTKQELEECCSCPVEANMYLALSINTDLSDNPGTGGPYLKRGLLGVVSSGPDVGGACNPSGVALKPGIRAWITHPEKAVSQYSMSVEQLTGSTINQQLIDSLELFCSIAGIGAGGAWRCLGVGR
jgi:hypothetical protein